MSSLSCTAIYDYFFSLGARKEIAFLLVYYAQAFYLVLTGKPLFFEEIRHRKQGPISPACWQHMLNPAENPSAPLEKEVLCLLDLIWARLPHEVSELHRKLSEEAPWLQTKAGQAITHASMKEYYFKEASSYARPWFQKVLSVPDAAMDEYAVFARNLGISELDYLQMQYNKIMQAGGSLEALRKKEQYDLELEEMKAEQELWTLEYKAKRKNDLRQLWLTGGWKRR